MVKGSSFRSWDGAIRRFASSLQLVGMNDLGGSGLKVRVQVMDELSLDDWHQFGGTATGKDEGMIAPVVLHQAAILAIGLDRIQTFYRLHDGFDVG